MRDAADLVRLAAAHAVAPAKINLALHVTGRRADGYHELDSLVAFAEDGDRLSVQPSERPQLILRGRFAGSLAETDDNLVTRALELARRVLDADGIVLESATVDLEKSLPVAAGIGGGSADAAALLRIVAAAVPSHRAQLRAASLALGADVPMCFDGVAARVTGIGEVSAPLTRFPAIPIVLVNPGVRLATPAVFAQLNERRNPPLPPIPARGFEDIEALSTYLQATRNDLEAPALRLVPAIGEARDALVAAGARFARMSGSGATVFALFDAAHIAEAAARRLAAARPEWWVLTSRTAGATTAGDQE